MKEMDFSKFELTEEKVKKLRSIFEKALSRKYDRKIEISTLTIGNITIKKSPHSNE
jgi:F0F1-type ATP synthase delta subunit